MMAKPEGKNHTEDRGVGGSLMMMTEWIFKKSVRNAWTVFWRLNIVDSGELL